MANLNQNVYPNYDDFDETKNFQNIPNFKNSCEWPLFAFLPMAYLNSNS